ncbi:MAG: hypothetical protein ABIR91_06020, partial [Candidatus Saccharimonadales bacterium]
MSNNKEPQGVRWAVAIRDRNLLYSVCFHNCVVMLTSLKGRKALMLLSLGRGITLLRKGVAYRRSVKHKHAYVL